MVDRYPHHISLKNRGFDNRPFINALKKKGGIFSSSMFSNYQNTYPSIPTTFHMNYFLTDRLKNGGLQSLQNSKTNQAIKILKINGYEITWVPSGYSGFNLTDADHRLSSGKIKFSEISILLAQTVFPTKIFLQKMGYIFPQDVASTIKKRKKPQFIFVHFMSVHDYVGPLLCTHSYSDDFYFHKIIEPFNDQMLQLLDVIQRNDPKAIIIIQSDHGGFNDVAGVSQFKAMTQDKKNIDFFIDSYGCLSCVFIPNISKTCDVYKKLSGFYTPINTFRLLFAYLSEANPKILSDRSFITRTDDDEKQSNMNSTVDANNIKEVSSYYPKVTEYIKEQEKLMETSKK